MDNSILENVVDRLEGAYDLHNKDGDLFSQLYFSTHYDCGGRGIVFNNIVLFCTADDGNYKPCHKGTVTEAMTKKVGTLHVCSDCETNCIEWNEDNIYNKCVGRLSALGIALTSVKSNKRVLSNVSVNAKNTLSCPKCGSQVIGNIGITKVTDNDIAIAFQCTECKYSVAKEGVFTKLEL